MIELIEGFYVDPFAVTVVRATGENKCVLYVTGEGAMDGHVLDYSAKEVVEVLNEEMGVGGDEEEAEDVDDDDES